MKKRFVITMELILLAVCLLFFAGCPTDSPSEDPPPPVITLNPYPLPGSGNDNVLGNAYTYEKDDVSQNSFVLQKNLDFTTAVKMPAGEDLLEFNVMGHISVNSITSTVITGTVTKMSADDSVMNAQISPLSGLVGITLTFNHATEGSHTVLAVLFTGPVADEANALMGGNFNKK